MNSIFFTLFLLTTYLRTFGGNPILDPIFNFFKSIWNGLSNLWNGLVSAINNWFHAVWNVNYMGIPVGPLLFVAISVGALFMLWGFMKLRKYLRTS